MEPTRQPTASPSERRRLPRAARFRKNVGNVGDTQLCSQCQSLNFNVIFSPRQIPPEGQRVCTVTWSNDERCTFCKFLDDMYDFKAVLRQDYTGRVLRCYRGVRQATASLVGNLILLRLEGTVAETTSYFTLQRPNGNGGAVRMVSPTTSFDVPKAWLEFCRSYHTNSCDTNPEFANSWPVANFRLIDCTTGHIIPATGQPYAALSYVWGSPASSSPGFSDRLRTDLLPETIDDAIMATKKMGLQYLWIDRYCINQQDAEEIAAQTNKMDLIYRNAELTIVAAAGEGPNHGLPGVRTRVVAQANVSVQSGRLVSLMDDPITRVRDSTWSQRGWTYQEGLLARRRLIFTEQQLYFECRSMYCCEAFNLSLPSLRTSDMQALLPRYHHRDHTLGLFPRRLGRDALDLIYCIKNYTKRELSQPCDILAAFSGILRTFEQGPWQIRHCAGVPILPRLVKVESWHGTEDASDSGWAWSRTTGFCLGLFWYPTQHSPRRTGFPSWSWAGRMGKIDWITETSAMYRYRSDPDLQIQVQVDGGGCLTLDEFVESDHTLDPRALTTLHFTAWVTPVKLPGLPHSATGEGLIGDCEIAAEINTVDGVRSRRWEFFPDSVTGIASGRRCLALHLGVDLAWKSYRTVLVILETGTPGLYERIGRGSLSVERGRGVLRLKEDIRLC